MLAVPWPSVSHMDAMDWQWVSNMRFRLLGGYFLGPAAAHQDVLHSVATSLAGPATPGLPGPGVRPEFLEELHEAGVRAVLLGQVPNRQHAVMFMSSLLGPPHDISGGMDIWLLDGSS